MKTIPKNLQRIIAVILAVCLAASYLPAEVLAEMMPSWEYRVLEDGTAALTGYHGSTAGGINVPSRVDALWVSQIDSGTFARADGAKITIPATVSELAQDAFPDSVTLSGYNGSAAMRYAAANGIPFVNRSAYDFYPEVLDLSELEPGSWTINSTTVSLPAVYAGILKEGTYVYLPPIAGMPDGSGFLLHNIRTEGASVLADPTLLTFFDVVREYRLDHQQVTLDWSRAVCDDGLVIHAPDDIRAASLNPADIEPVTVEIINREYKHSYGIYNVSGRFLLTATPHVTCLADWEGLKYLDADLLVEGRVNATIQTSYEKTEGPFSADGKDPQLYLGKLQVPGVTAGLLTQVWNISIYATVGGSLSFETTFTVDPAIHFSETGGLFLEKGPTTSSLSPVGVVVEGHAGITMTASADFSIGFAKPVWMTGINIKDLAFKFAQLEFAIPFSAKIKSSVSFGCFDLEMDVSPVLTARVGLLSVPEPIGALCGSLMKLMHVDPSIMDKLKFEKSITHTIYHGEKHWERQNARWQDECEGDLVTVDWYVSGALWDSAKIQRGDPLPSCKEPMPIDGMKFTGWHVLNTDYVKPYGNYPQNIYTSVPIAPSTPIMQNTKLDAGFASVYKPEDYQGKEIPFTPGQSSHYYPTPTDSIFVGRVDINYAEAEGADVFVPYRYNDNEVAYYNLDRCNTATFGEGYTRLTFHRGIWNHEDDYPKNGVFLPDSIEYVYMNCGYGNPKITLLSDIPKSITDPNILLRFSYDQRTSVTIPSEITRIPGGVLMDCTNLQSVSMGSKVETIEGIAFANCTRLSSITLPPNVTEIGREAFLNCASLSSFKIPSSITLIQSGLFRGCTGLSSITWPSTVTDIFGSAFENCANLALTTIPATDYIGYQAFAGCPIVNVTINDVNLLEDTAFSGCPLQEITILDTSKHMGDYRFANYMDLRTIRFYPEDFFDLSISNCPNLLAIYVHKGSAAEQRIAHNFPYLRILYLEGGERGQEHLVHFDTGLPMSIADVIAVAGEAISMPADPEYKGLVFTGWYLDESRTTRFDAEKDRMPDSTLILYAGWKTKDPEYQIDIETGMLSQITFAPPKLVIPESIGNRKVTSIGAYAIPAQVEELTIPAGVTSIDTAALAGAMFLKRIEVAPGNPIFRSVDGVLYDRNGTLLCYPAGREDSEFAAASITTAIAPNAFCNAYNLVTVSFPKSLKRIEENAFSGCASLSLLKFAADVEFFADNALSLSGTPILQCEANAPVLTQWAQSHSAVMNLQFVIYWNGEDILRVLALSTGSSLFFLEGPNDSDRTIIGWAYDAEGTRLVDWGKDRVPAGNLNLYAVFGSSYRYTLNAGGEAELTRYLGASSVPYVPTRIDGHRVASIAADAYPEGILSIQAEASNTVARQYALERSWTVIPAAPKTNVDTNWSWQGSFATTTPHGSGIWCATLNDVRYGGCSWINNADLTITAETNLPDSHVQVVKTFFDVNFYTDFYDADEFVLTITLHRNDMNEADSEQYADLVITKHIRVDETGEALWSWNWNPAASVFTGDRVRIGRLENVRCAGTPLTQAGQYTVSCYPQPNGAELIAEPVPDDPGAMDLFLCNAGTSGNMEVLFGLHCTDPAINSRVIYHDETIQQYVRLSDPPQSVGYEDGLMDTISVTGYTWLGNIYSVHQDDLYLSCGTDYTVTAEFDQPGLNVELEASPNVVNFFLVGPAPTCDAVLTVHIRLIGQDLETTFTKQIHIDGVNIVDGWSWDTILFDDISTGSGMWLGNLYNVCYDGVYLYNYDYTVEVQADLPGVTVTVDRNDGWLDGVNFNMHGVSNSGPVTVTFTVHKDGADDLVFTKMFNAIGPEDAIAPTVLMPDTSPLYVGLWQEITLPRPQMVGGCPNNSDWELYVGAGSSDASIASCWTEDSVPHIFGANRGAVMLTLYARSCFDERYMLPLYSRPVYVDCTPVDTNSIQNWLILPEQLKEIDEEAFAGILAEAVRVPDQCERISSRAFADCPNLIYVEIPAGITLAEDAFADCSAVILRR